jgi:transposase, IS5 family
VRFRKLLIAQGLDQVTFELVNRQPRAGSVAVRTGTLVDATVIASASQGDREAGWLGHRARKAVHSDKAHVAADADTGLVERIDVTPGNVHDGRADGAVVPDDPGLVYADSAYRGSTFTDAVVAKGGEPRVVATHDWARKGNAAAEAAFRARNGAIHRIRARIEKIFGTWKRSYGLRRMRWRGLAKAALQVRLTAVAYNLRRGVSLLQAA